VFYCLGRLHYAVREFVFSCFGTEDFEGREENRDS
jgi:hypothetical protein